MDPRLHCDGKSGQAAIKADEPSVDDIVVFGEDGLGRGSYQKGRILKRFHGKDRVARSSRGIMSDKSDSSL